MNVKLLFSDLKRVVPVCLVVGAGMEVNEYNS